MENLLTPDTAIKFLLVECRVGGLFISMPIFSSPSIPMQVKVLLSFMIAFLVFPLVMGGIPVPRTVEEFALLLLNQIFIGFCMGLGVLFVFTAIQMAGALIDLQIGFAMASILDPQSQTQTTLFSNAMHFITIVLFLGLNGHHWAITGILNSFRLIPIDRFIFSPAFIQYVQRSFGDIFPGAFHIAFPIIIAIMLVDIVVGFVARTAPQMNLMVISMPFKIGLGFFLLSASFGIIIYIMEKMLEQLYYPLLKCFYY